MTQLNGILVVDKPPGPTSHDVVLRARRQFKIQVGHTGTLDPQATGVLPLALGQATRLTRFFQAKDKEYLAEIRLGKVTDTLDRTGRVIKELAVPFVSSAQVERTLARFRGEIRQVPPMFSAVKVNGQRLYRLARQRQETERSSRAVSIYRLQLLQRTTNTWVLTVHCSAGTYVRSLAHDIGQHLGCGACLNNLRRTRAGNFDLSRNVTVEELSTQWQGAFYSLQELLPEFPRIDLGNESASRIRHGTRIPWETEDFSGLHRLFYAGKLIAIGELDNQCIHPKVVLNV